MSYFNLDNLQKYKFEPELIYLSHIKNHIKKVAVTNEGNQYLEGCGPDYLDLEELVPIKTLTAGTNIISIPKFNKNDSATFSLLASLISVLC